MEYSIWRACERWGILPPGVKSSWEEMENINNLDIMAKVLAYEQIRDHEEFEYFEAQMKAAGMKSVPT